MLTSLSELFKKESYDNATALFDDAELDKISQKVRFDYEQDLTTCSRKFEELKKIMALAMIVSETKSYPWNGASNIIYPLVANAAINFGASCYPEIIQDDEVVKAKIIGKDNGKIFTDAVKGEKVLVNPEKGEFKRIGAGEKLKQGTRVATMMNWQLLEQMTWWEGDIDKEVHSLPILGTLYKKVYYDSLKKMPVSELIFPDKIVINNNARDIDSAIVTQLIELYPQEILERIRSGYYKEFDFNLESLRAQTSDTDANLISISPANSDKKEDQTNTNLHLFLEQHTWLDLDEDGFLEPYIATIHYNSCKTVRLVPRFKEKNIVYNEKGQIQEIKARKYFVVRRFLPSFDGGFMGMGFGHLLSNMNHAINTTLNQMVDAGHLSITGGGLISKNVKLRGGKLVVSLNEYKMVDVAGGDLVSSIYPFPKTEPSPVLFTLLGSLVEAGKELGSMRDVLNGDVAANVAPTTMMSLVEQGMKQFKSIYKRYYKSLKTEFKLLYDIDSEHLTDEEYLNILDEDAETVSVKTDFDERSYNIVPVADVNAINSAQKLAQANFLMGFVNHQNIDNQKLLKQIFEVARIPNTDDLIVPTPPPQPAPAVQVAQMKMQAEMGKLQFEQQQYGAEIEKFKLEFPKILAEIEKIRTASMVDLATVNKLAKETEIAEITQQLDVYDNIVDAETKKIEVAGRMHDAELKHQTELLKLTHAHVQNEMDREHELKLAKSSKPEAKAE